MDNNLPKSNMKQVAVLGLGRFGTEVTKALYSYGCEVLAVDESEEKTYEVADFATHTVATNVAEESNLKSIGITDFDAVIIAIGDNIQASIITALTCKEMGVNYIVAKAQNDKHAKVLKKIGVDYVVIPEADTAVKTARILTHPKINDLIEIAANYSLAEIDVPKEWIGRPLIDLDIRNRYAVNVLVVIGKNGDVNANPYGATVLGEGCKLIVGGNMDDIGALSSRLS